MIAGGSVMGMSLYFLIHFLNKNLYSDSLLQSTNNESEDSSENELSLNATALYDFKARSHREVNLKKGQKLKLVSRVSSDWWRGVVLDAEEDTLGLIPHKYIDIKGYVSLLLMTLTKNHLYRKPTKTPPTKRKISCEPPIAPPQDLESKLEPQPSTSTSSNQNQEEKKESSKFTPDLVLDLPSSPSSSSSSTTADTNSSSSSDESEPNTVVTAAEVFAKQNQCTLKKISGIKPKVMAKPKLPRISNKEFEEEEIEEKKEDSKTE
jgi:hypothetical protein